MSRTTTATVAVVAVALLGVALAGCGGGDDSEPACELTLPGVDEEPFDRLRDYCFFQGEPAKQHEQTSEGVVPYDVRSKLYSDESDKFRFVVLPDGETIEYDPKALWGFPEGSIIIKTFYFPDDARNPGHGRRLLETRLMMKRDGEWDPQIYKWNEEQTRAKRYVLGEDVEVEWTDENGETVSTNYRIPNKNKCQSCHARDNDVALLGPRTRQLNRSYQYDSGEKNQLNHFEEAGMFDRDVGSPEDLPQLAEPKDESLSVEARARAYLEGNCAHCHDPAGGGSNSGLFLGIEQDDRSKLGVCKRPVAAGGGTGGYDYDIKPGHPEESIMIFRMKSNDPEIKMPELPLRTVDEFGVEIVSKWIAQMRPKGCSN